MNNSSKRRFRVTKRLVFYVLGYVMLFLLYQLNDFGSRTSSVSQGFLILAEHRLPVSMLAGVFSSISTVILICWVVFYHRFGLITSLVILAIRSLRLTSGLVQFHASSFPAIFITMVAVFSVILIYVQNEKIQKVQKKHQKELEEFNHSIIGAFASCIDGKDEYTNGHSFRVARYTKMLAEKLGESPENVENIYNIALLHDIGKIGIPDAILNKPGKLTADEYELMKSHAQRGYDILKDVKTQEDIAVGARHHHERFDGTGYPAGLAAFEIPWVARIISVADAFDAMSSTRPYRKRLPMDQIIEEIKKCSGTQFDPAVAHALLELYKDGAFKDLELSEEAGNELRQEENPREDSASSGTVMS